MDRIHIVGGNRLEGAIAISGAKNSALKLMAAALLTDAPLSLTRMPQLADTRFMARLLEHLGVSVENGSSQMTLDAASLAETTAPYDLVRKMRATFNVLGPLLAREGRARVSLPGGCAIGARPVDLHLDALRTLGAEIELDGGYVEARAPNGLRGGHVVFPFVSVGATEHALLAAALAKGESLLENAAREPEIVDLANCLVMMGAKIEGAGESLIRVQGVDRLSGGTHQVVADRIEAGTYAIAVAATGGEVLLEGAEIEHNAALWDVLARLGASVEPQAGGLKVARNGTRARAIEVVTAPYPGFPTDLQAQLMALAAIAEGTSTITENIFENRFMHAPELGRMGADIHVTGRTAAVHGVEKLRGAPVMATDLRASVSLVIAGLVAEGETVVHRVYHLDRGFERLEDKLSACGARIERRSGSE